MDELRLQEDFAEVDAEEMRLHYEEEAEDPVDEIEELDDFEYGQ